MQSSSDIRLRSLRQRSTQPASAGSVGFVATPSVWQRVISTSRLSMTGSDAGPPSEALSKEPLGSLVPARLVVEPRWRWEEEVDDRHVEDLRQEIERVSVEEAAALGVE